jgi:hypothetical protein
VSSNNSHRGKNKKEKINANNTVAHAKLDFDTHLLRFNSLQYLVSNSIIRQVLFFVLFRTNTHILTKRPLNQTQAPVPHTHKEENNNKTHKGRKGRLSKHTTRHAGESPVIRWRAVKSKIKTAP